MFVCICNALRDTELAHAATDSAHVAEVFKKCGSRPQCGKCLPDVAEMIEEARSDNSSCTVAAE